MSPKPLPSFGDTLKIFSFVKIEPDSSDEGSSYFEKKYRSEKFVTHSVTTKSGSKRKHDRDVEQAAHGSNIQSDDENRITGLHLQTKTLKKSKKRAYAGPEVYAHLAPLVPLLQEGLTCVFVGFNPGIKTAVERHYYAHPSNGFWKMMSQSGCVNRKVTHLDDVKLPEEFQYGFHDLVSRPTRGIDELSAEEMLNEVPRLEAELQKHQPKIIAFVGKGIWEKIYKYKTKKTLKARDFQWGIQYRPPKVLEAIEERGHKFITKHSKNNIPALPFEFAVGHCTIFVLPSTSGIATSPSPQVRLELWKSLAEEIAFQRTLNN